MIEGPRFDYHAHGPDGAPDGMGALTRKPLKQPVMACTSCGYFAPRRMVTGARCATPNCSGNLYEWLHPDWVEVLDPSVFAPHRPVSDLTSDQRDQPGRR